MGGNLNEAGGQCEGHLSSDKLYFPRGYEEGSNVSRVILNSLVKAE